MRSSHTFGILHLHADTPSSFHNGTISSISIEVCPTRGARSLFFVAPLRCDCFELFNHGGVLHIFLCKTLTPKRLHARNGSMKSISIHVSTTFGAFPHVREMSVADAGDEILGQRAIFQETLRHLL